jgi:tRNA (guanine37-N1)-methyltransferase
MRTMHFDVLTLFPGMFNSPLSESMLKRSIQAEIITVRIINIRDFAAGKHKQADDRPYGGGSGMVLMPEPIVAALRSVVEESHQPKNRLILLSPQGQRFNQAKAHELAGLDRLVLLCGHYEGVDERIRQHYVDEDISIGDYVLTGGELAAMIIIDAVARLLPGVLGDDESLTEESFSEGLLEYPHYTRPEEFEGHRVPEILLSGHHEKVKRWRKKESMKNTLLKRPDLVNIQKFAGEDRDLLETLKREIEG